MITVITGLPGNGKTLYALYTVKAYAEKENREVFYSGIKDLRLPWTEIKAEEWASCPTGAIIVIDEAQFVFPKKPNGSKLPEFYEKLAVHRHSGYDIYIITQHPGLVDNFVKNLCGRHLHVIRKFGMQRANVWEWAAANTSPEKPASHKGAILHKFGYPKEVYEYYKSAEVHTVKRSIPMKLILAVLFVVVVVVVFFYVMNRLREKGTKNDATPVAGAAPAGVVAGAAGKSTPVDPITDAKQYVFEHLPRYAGLPHTAPIYDEIRKPTEAPMPVACVQSASRCNCFTQQATKMDVPKDICQQIVANGFFDDARPKQEGAKREGREYASPVQSANAVPASAIGNDRVVVLDSAGYGVLGSSRDKPQSAL